MSSKRLICSDQATEWQHYKMHVFETTSVILINTAPLMAGRPYLRWLYLWRSGQVFQLVKHIKVLKQERKQSTIQSVNKKGKRNEPEPSIDYQPSKEEWLWCTRCTRLATFHAMHIEPIKAFTFLQINIKFTRPTYLYFESISSLQGLPRPPRSCGSPDRLIAHNNQIARPPSARVERI